MLVNPENAVQWTLYYPAVADPAALLAGAGHGEADALARQALDKAGAGDVSQAFAALRQDRKRLTDADAPALCAAAYVALMAGEPG